MNDVLRRRRSAFSSSRTNTSSACCWRTCWPISATAWPPRSAPSPRPAKFAASGEFNAAILDVNLDGQEIFPVADILAGRSLPFVFVTGYGERSLPERFRDRPALQKPFQAEQLKQPRSPAARALAETLPPAWS